MFLLSFTDYAEELRFYLIHMTEVRDLCERVCVCMHTRTHVHVWGSKENEAETEGKTGSKVNSLFGL